MNSDPASEPETIDQLLARKFPNLRRGRKTPGLTLINGCGTRLSGKRDFDPETGSYVATRVFALVFIPVVALSAWRIIPAGGSRFHVLGQEPLSALARRANLLLAAAVLVLTGMGAWQSWRNSPEYLAKAAMERAAEAMTAGNPLAAMKEYENILDHDWPAGDAREKYAAAFDAALRTGPAADRCHAVTAARTATIGRHHLLADEAARIMAWAGSEPDAAMVTTVMKAALPAVPESDRVPYEARRRELLEKLTAASPDSVEAAVDLASIYDDEDRPADCRKLLEPHLAVLGSGEGARILGRIMVHEGKYREGADLLRSYSGSRLKEYHAAEKQAEAIYKSVSDEAIADLNGNRGPASFYRNYTHSTEEAKQRMVEEYISGQMKKSPRVTAAQERLASAGAVVPVMIDLGIASLHLAREEQDAGKRKQGLEEAEKQFLSIQGAAGESTEYRLFLGQVYYWMGKHSEGKALFDKLLAGTRDTGITLMVAESVRQVGDMDEARRISEKAWKDATTKEDRTRAAVSRAMVYKDTDDRIQWLDRCEVRSPRIDIDLLEAKAAKKVKDGKKSEAVPLLRSALAGYEKEPRSASTLNNSANVLATLYGITHDPADAREGLNRYEEASRLEPEDTVLLQNLESGYMHRVYLDLGAGFGDLKTLPPGIEFLIVSMMSRNTGEATKLAGRIHDSDPSRKAARILEKLLVLAPRDLTHCRSLQTLHGAGRQIEELKKLVAHVKGAAFDMGARWAEARKYWAEDHDAETLAAVEGAMRETEAALGALTPAATPELRAALTAQLLTEKATRCRLTKSGEPGELMAAAEALVKQWPAAGAYGVAQNALLRATVMQASADAEFAALAASSRRQLDDGRLVAFALQKGIGVAALKASPALKKWRELTLLEAASWAEWRGIVEWAILRHLDAGAANVCGGAVLKDEFRLTDIELNTLLAPWDADTVVDAWALHQLRGDEKSAAAVWADAKAHGMPLPDL